jgi:hypothetical protein
MTGTAKTKKKPVVETWPDGTVMDAWFKDTTKVDIAKLGRQYVITDYGVKNDSTIVKPNLISRSVTIISNNHTMPLSIVKISAKVRECV